MKNSIPIIVVVAMVAVIGMGLILINTTVAEHENQNDKNSLSIKGLWLIQVLDKNGNVIDQRNVENVVTNTGMQVILATATTSTYIPKNTASQSALSSRELVVGDCGGAVCTPPDVTDTALENQLLGAINRAFTPAVSSSDNSVTQEFTVDRNTAETLREAGLVTSNFDDVLVNRVTFDPITVPADGAVRFAVTLQLSNAP